MYKIEVGNPKIRLCGKFVFNELSLVWVHVKQLGFLLYFNLKFLSNFFANKKVRKYSFFSFSTLIQLVIQRFTAVYNRNEQHRNWRIYKRNCKTFIFIVFFIWNFTFRFSIGILNSQILVQKYTQNWPSAISRNAQKN